MNSCNHESCDEIPVVGVPGATFVPGVEEVPEGYEVSWENNRNLPNPDPVRLLHGKSAYQLAVEADYEGTEVEFAAEMADAAVAKAKAEAAAEAAGKSETNAAAAADAAAQSEQNAKDSEEAAQQAAGEAAQLAQAAAGSAGAASLSEQNAAASEQAAEDAAEEAGKEATAAGNAAGAAARSEANAKTSEENAARSEEEAKKAAQEAQGVILSGPAQPGQLLLVESVSEDGKLLKCTAVDPTHYWKEDITEILAETELEFNEYDPGHIIPYLGLAEGDAYIVAWNGAVYACTAFAFTVEGTSGIAVGNPKAFDGEDNGIPFFAADVPQYDGCMVIAMDSSATNATISVKVDRSELKKFDPIYLPEGVPYTETVLAAPTFDGNLEGREYVDAGDGMYLVKISDQMMTADDLIGATATGILNGENLELTIDQGSVDDKTANGVPLIMALYGDMPMVLCVNGDVSSAIPLSLSTGVWSMCAPGVFWTSSLSCLQPIETKAYHKLDNGCLDLEWLPTHTTEETEVLPTTQFGNFTKGTDSSGKTVYNSLDMVAVIEPIVAGKEYTVYWNGVGYTFTAYEQGSFVALGTENDAFAVVYAVDDNAVYFGQYAETDSATVRITYNVKTPKKLPNEFLDLDWVPERKYEEGAEVIPKQVVSADSPQATGGYYGSCTVENPSDTLLKEGKTYEVEWNGTKYLTVCTVISSGTAMLGNGTIDGLDMSPDGDTSCPFLIMSNSLGVSLLTATETLVTLRVIEKTELPNPMPKEFMPESVDYIILNSSTEGSTKKFKLTIDDSGTPSYTEVTT